MSSVKSCPLEESLCRPKSKKCCKVQCDPIDCCPSVLEVDPCACESAMDCCSLPYQRLDKLRSMLVTNVSSSLSSEGFDATLEDDEIHSDYTYIRQRNGAKVVVPTAALFGDVDATNYTLQGFFAPQEVTVPASTSMVPLEQNHGRFDNAALAYNFVQTMRYNMCRDVACASADQVIGFFYNPSQGQLQVFQDLTGPLNALALTYTDSLQYYNSLTILTNAQKQKLVSLNILNDLGLSAVRRVNLNPKTEGNIMKVVDKCCNEWLLVIATADVPLSVGYCPGVNGYVIVACRLPEHHL